MVIFQDPSTRSLIHNKVKQSTLILYQPESLLDKKTGIITEVRQMLEIRFVRASPEIVKADLLKRNAQEKIAWVDEILAKDARSRELKDRPMSCGAGEIPSPGRSTNPVKPEKIQHS